jgi:hypothetical protein
MSFSKLYQWHADSPDRPLVAQITNNYPAFYGTRTVMIVFTPALSWYPASNQKNPVHTSLEYILIF